MVSRMSRALIIDKTKIIELFGNHYIAFSEWNPTISDHKVTSNETLTLVDALDESFTASIFKKPLTTTIYDQNLTIKKNQGSINISKLAEEAVLYFDSNNNLITNQLDCGVYKNYELCNEFMIDYQVGDVFHISTLVSIVIKDNCNYEVTCYEPKEIRIVSAS